MKRVFAFVGFSIAITLFLLNCLPFESAKFILLSAVILLILSLLIKALRQERVVPLVLGSAVFACLIFIISMQSNVQVQKNLDGKTACCSFQIVDIESKTEGGYLYTVKTNFVDLPDAPQNIKLKVKANGKINADYYDNVNGLVTFYSFADNGFDSYGDYGDGIFIRAKLINSEAKVNSNKPPNYYIIKLRLKIKDILYDNLDEEKAGLGLSLFTGDKRLLNDDVKESFKVCGISHMTAVSGLHISIICLCIYYLLKLLRVPRIPCTVVTLAVLLVYSGVADFSKSVIRAGIMITAMLISKLVNNKADTLNSLGFAVFIICLNPFAVTDAGAVLTVSAVVGLSVIKPAIDIRIRPENKALRYFYDGFFTGVCVLAATFPAMWFFFGNVSLLALILNIIGIPLLELALISLLLLCLFSPIPFLAFIPKCLSSFSLGSLIDIADFSKSHFEFLYLNVSDGLYGVMIAGALLLIAFSLLATNKIDIKTVAALISVMVVIVTAFSVFDYRSNAYLTVSADGAVIVHDRDTMLAIDIDENGDCYLLEDIVGTKKYDTSVAINSLKCQNGITDALPNTEFASYDGEMPYLCEHISVSYENDILCVSVYNKVFKIYEDYVTIDSCKVYRDVYDRFSQTGDTTFVVTENAEIQIKQAVLGLFGFILFD